MSGNRGVVVDPGAEGRLVIRDVPESSPLPFEAVIRVRAVSLNRGEVRRSMAARGGLAARMGLRGRGAGGAPSTAAARSWARAS